MPVRRALFQHQNQQTDKLHIIKASHHQSVMAFSSCISR